MKYKCLNCGMSLAKGQTICFKCVQFKAKPYSQTIGLMPEKHTLKKFRGYNAYKHGSQNDD